MMFGKYKEIVAAIAVFIVLDAGVLLLNFYATYQISDDAHAIRLASRQAMLTQRIFHNVEQMREDLIKERSFEGSQQRLAHSYKQFDEVLDAFIYGGELIGLGQGQDSLLLGDDYHHLSELHLKPAEDIWKSYRLKVSSLVYADYFDEDSDLGILLKKANIAIAEADQVGDQLLEAVSDFSDALEAQAHDKAVNLRTIQAIAISLAIINFFVILFHFLRRLNRSDQLAEKSKKETLEILETVNDGLFLLDEKYTIGSQYSSSMKTLFRHDDFEGMNFFDLLENLVSPDDKEIARDYVDSLFNERVKSSLMDELNPLKHIAIYLSGASSHAEYKEVKNYFDFSFSRVFEGDKIIHLLVSVKDVTDVKLMSDKIDENAERLTNDYKSLLLLMNVDFYMLKDFSLSFESALLSINEELGKPDYSLSSLGKKLGKIKRFAHSIKGESSMLGLVMVSAKVHELENKIAVLSERPILEGDDFLMIALEVNNLMDMMEYIKEYINKASALIQANGVDAMMESSGHNYSGLNHALNDLVVRMSKDFGKKVHLDLSQCEFGLIPEGYVMDVKKILIQLIRNAIVHGLEKPKKRLALAKPEQGVVSVVVENKNDEIMICVKDDGRGIDFKAIKKYVLAQKGYDVSYVDKMSPKELVKFIFTSGFSAAKKMSHYAGRGVGLDVVKTLVDDMGAYLSVSCKANQSSEFRIRIPRKVQLEKLAS